MSDRAPDDQGNLRRLRLRLMLTQEELATKAGVSTRTVRHIESGKVRPQPKTLRLLANALGLGEPGDSWPSGSLSRPTPVPRELPRGLDTFAGRQQHLDGIISAVADGATVVTVQGMAGIGKTTLAVRAAHALAPRYPDGQFFVDLLGFTDAAVHRPDAVSVMARVLRSLNVDARDIPVDAGELTARYRSILAGRRVLLLLDDAAAAEQVEALLPGTPDSLIVATSRRNLSALPTSYSVLLEPPSLPEAVTMIDAAAVGRTTAAEAQAIAQRCGRLPLAMGLAAARLRSRPHWRVSDLLQRLTDEDRLLDELDGGHRKVAATLAASYRELDPEQQRLLRRLSVVPGDDVDLHAAAAVGGTESRHVSPILESLVDVHMVETRSPGRYRLHDLVRLFVARIGEAEETDDDRHEALGRLFGVYLHFGYRAIRQWTWPNQMIYTESMATYELGLPGVSDKESAEGWFRAERGNLAAAAYAAQRTGQLETAWHLATVTSAFRVAERDNEQLLTVNRLALEVARQLEDEPKQAHSLAERGRHLLFIGNGTEAVRNLEAAAALKRRLGDLRGAAMAMRNIGLRHRQSGRFDEALDVYREGLELAEGAADGAVIVLVGTNMFVPLLRLGRLAEAQRCLADAELRMQDNDVYDPVRIENFRGTLARELGDPATALTMHTDCLEICDQRDFRGGIVPILIELGEDLICLDRITEAVSRLRSAVEHATELASPSNECTARNTLGRALTARGDVAAAIEQHERALRLAQSQEDAYEQAKAHHGLADAYQRDGDGASARQQLGHAAKRYAQCGVPEASMVTETLRNRRWPSTPTS